jgi:hypothetical protein
MAQMAKPEGGLKGRLQAGLPATRKSESEWSNWLEWPKPIC